mmetsp:Transcript_12756/g.29388  ORF Transcript_12756/g.29388 Transcript_12756/m.29388 type:complete len:208 (-) Transcript_12756:576-1199(-)
MLARWGEGVSMRLTPKVTWNGSFTEPKVYLARVTTTLARKKSSTLGESLINPLSCDTSIRSLSTLGSCQVLGTMSFQGVQKLRGGTSAWPRRRQRLKFSWTKPGTVQGQPIIRRAKTLYRRREGGYRGPAQRQSWRSTWPERPTCQGHASTIPLWRPATPAASSANLVGKLIWTSPFLKRLASPALPTTTTPLQPNPLVVASTKRGP